MIFDADGGVGEESVVRRLVREIEGKGHAKRSEVVLPLDPHLCPSEVFFQPPAVIVVALSAARRRPLCELCGMDCEEKEELSSRRRRRRRRTDRRRTGAGAGEGEGEREIICSGCRRRFRRF